MLQKYLSGEPVEWKRCHFQKNPWTAQVLPHIQMKPGVRQVKDEDGYFTEVAVRLKPGWRLAVALNETVVKQGGSNVIRLGGEGHRALVSLLPYCPAMLGFVQDAPADGCDLAYLLAPGLAQAEEETPHYAATPWYWPELQGCATDRPLYWGGVSRIWRRKGASDRTGRTETEESQTQQTDSQPDEGEFALLPQRAFVPPGTVYAFSNAPKNGRTALLPPDDSRWLETFRSLNYGKLLWGKRP